jgi:hypothetical protein
MMLPSRRARVTMRIFSATLIAAAACALLWPSSAIAAPVGSFSMQPSTSQLDIGDTVSITLDLGGINIGEVDLQVTYDPAVVQVVDFDAGQPGVQVLPGNFPGNDTAGDVIENSAGSGAIDYHYDLDGTDEVSGNGTVATVLFEAIGNGDAQLAWSVRTLRDGSGAATTASASAASVVVGNVAPPATATPQATGTPAATSTPAPTNTPGATSTATAASTGTATRTPTATGTATVTRTPAATPTATVAALTTPRITVLQNTNSGTPAPRQNNGVNPDQTDRANGLPTAGNEGPGITWWRWWFFGAALLVGVAGWFFTFAVHVGDKDVILMDRFDTRRRRHRRP